MSEKNILAAILVIALLLSVSASVITMTKLGPYGLFAAATASGRGEVNITEVIVLTVTISEIALGNGTVSWDSRYAFMNTYAGTVIDGSWTNASQNITFRNDGNVGMNVTVMFDKRAGKNNESFMCADEYGTDQTGSCGEAHFDGVDITGNSDAALDFQYQVTNIDSINTACANNSYGLTGLNPQGERYGWKNNTNSWGMINATYTEYQVCPCMRSADGYDEMAMFFRFGIPEDADGDKVVTATLTGYKTPPADYPGCT